MIGARWANAEVGRPAQVALCDLAHPLTVNTAQTQDNEEMTVPLASKALNVGERGIYHARIVLEKGSPE